MTAFVLGLLLFLGLHSVRIVADDWRSRQIAAHGEKAWKAGYALLSIVGFGLLVWGYGQARQQPVVLWQPPAGMRHAAAALTLPAFVLLAAAYVPANRLKARIHHPMVAGVKLWALAHLLANGTLADVLLFGGFLAWAVVLFAASRRRDRRLGTAYPPGRTDATIATVVLGIAAWALFAFQLHTLLIGVAPFAPRG